MNFISKSKIKDKIEQLKEKEESDLRCYGFAVDTHLALQTLQELLDGNDTNVGSIGNSIEEEIETLEELRTHGYAMLLMKYEDRIKTNRKIDQALEHIVSDYKKVLKENEILKEEKEQAWEEWNNLEQGSYGTEQKLKQQIKELRKENEELIYARNWYFEHTVGKICTPEMLDKILRNDYIPKSKLKDIIDRIDYDIKKTKEIISKNTNINASYRKNDYQIVRLRAMNTKSLDIKNRLQKLLESEE